MILNNGNKLIIKLVIIKHIPKINIFFNSFSFISIAIKKNNIIKLG